MSESKLTFFEDGPVKYTYEEFCEFRKILSEYRDAENGGFDVMCFIWVDGHYPQHVRNLCLRNILRQIGEKRLNNNYPTAYNYCNVGFGRLLFLLNKEDQFLRRTLQFQPDLCQNFCAELLYNLDRGFRNALPYVFVRNDLDRLIMLLVKITDQATGLRLWHYHTFEIDLLNNLRETLSFCEESFVPRWLREHIIAEIKGICKSEFQDNLDFFSSQNCISSAFINSTHTDQQPSSTDSAKIAKDTPSSKPNHLWPVISHIEFQAKSMNGKQVGCKFDLSLQFIEMFEEGLPLPMTYIDQHNFADVAVLIQEPSTLYSFVSRHILAFPPEKYIFFQEPRQLIVLRYLRDFVNHYAPGEHYLAYKLDQIIDYRPAELEDPEESESKP